MQSPSRCYNLYVMQYADMTSTGLAAETKRPPKDGRHTSAHPWHQLHARAAISKKKAGMENARGRP
eukprot:365293-Chlamydomonas_euryale.AAC.7